MTDSVLHCNWLKCRKSLLAEGKAVVTTCSHIFCVTCAEQLFTADKQCPACKTVLKRPDDVVLSSLNPTMDYRTSVLAGLSPDIAVDVLARSLAFWQYQQGQELAYHVMLLNAAQEQNRELEARLQKVISEANQEIQLLQGKEAELQATIRELHKTNADLRKLSTRRVPSRSSASPLDSRSSNGGRQSHGQSHSRSDLIGSSIGPDTASLAGHSTSATPPLLWQTPSRAFSATSTLQGDALVRSASTSMPSLANNAASRTKPSTRSSRASTNGAGDDENARSRPQKHFKREDDSLDHVTQQPHPFLNTTWESSNNLNRFKPVGEVAAIDQQQRRLQSFSPPSVVRSSDAASAASGGSVIHRPSSVLGHLVGRNSHLHQHHPQGHGGRPSLDRIVSGNVK